LAQETRELSTTTPQRSDGWEKLRSALPVAAVWTGIAAVVELLIVVVLAPRGPSSVLIFLTYGRTRTPYFRMAASDLFLVSWILLAVIAVIIAVSFLFRRRQANWPLVVGLLLSILVPWFLSSELLSVLFQLGMTEPATSMSGGTQAVIFVSNLVFVIIGAASVLVVSTRRRARA
jgi:hypothetical protein